MKYGGNKKKIVFYDTDDRHVDLKVKLQYHGMTQASFFRAVVSGLIDSDELFLKFLLAHKQENNIQSKRQQKVVAKTETETEEIEKDFSLKKDEISDIFDLIEREHPDL
tara:strand:+ start:104 stop:430 length:327 start_codon:yes stop_codon:yes gene_type:complete